MIIKLTGSVHDVFQSQEHTEEEISEHLRNRGSAINKSIIKVDLPRTALVDYSGKTFTDFVNECSRDEVYSEQYSQGNLDGGDAITAYVLSFAHKASELYSEATELPGDSPERTQKEYEADLLMINWSSAQKNLRFAYRDDNGELCSLGFVFNIDKPDNWVLQITRNTTASMESRTATLFAQGEIVRAPRSTTVDAHALSGEITSALGNGMVAKLVSDIIDENGNVSVDKFHELDIRIKANRNLVNFESRVKQLDDEIKRLAVELPGNPRIIEASRKLRLDSSDVPNFFNDAKFQSTIDTIHNIEEYEKRLEDFKGALFQFQKRNMTKEEKKLHAEGNKLLESIEAIAGNDLSLLNKQSLIDLNQVLAHSTTALNNPKDTLNMGKLVELSQRVSGQPSPKWQALGKALLGFAAIALVVAGVLAAIPSGGASLLLVAGALGITAGISGAAAAGIFSHNSKKGLAKSVSDFKSARDDVKSTKEDEPSSKPPH